MSLEYTAKFTLQKEMLKNNLGLAVRNMLTDIHRESNPVTPKRPDPIGGTLRTDVLEIMEGPTTGSIYWNAPYAAYQERGFTTGVVVNYSTPGTHAHFARDSVETVMRRARDYFVQTGAII